MYWKAKGEASVVTKDEKSTDKKYVYDRVFNPDENNTIVYRGELRANSIKWTDPNIEAFNPPIIAHV